MSTLPIDWAHGDCLLIDEGSWHTRRGAKILLGIESIRWMYVWTNIAPIGITACIPKSPSGSSWSTGDGGGVGLEKVELIGWIFVNSTTNYNQ